jgi:hypothetical protein
LGRASPLTGAEQEQVRALSTRARITATSFTNEYHWGNFRGDPRRMVERFYDAHLYLANWGTHQIMLRLPKTVLSLKGVEPYLAGDQVTAWTSGANLVLDLTSEDESGDWVEDAEDSLSAIAGVRAELAAGDLRPLYLAWLSAYGTWERDEDAFDYDDEQELEPPLPPGLGALTAPQRALADFLRLDRDLLSIAAQTSTALHTAAKDPKELAAWVAALPTAEKNRLLVRVAGDQAAAVHVELLRRFHGTPAARSPEQDRRTVAELLDAAAKHRLERERRAEAEHAAVLAREEQVRQQRRKQRLDAIADDIAGTWDRVETLISARKASEYDAAVALLQDLHAVAQRADHDTAFTLRCADLRQHHFRKPAFIQRLDHAGL